MKKEFFLKKYLLKHKGKLFLSSLLSIINSILGLVPFISVFKILTNIFNDQVNASDMMFWGWIALASIGVLLILTFASTMLSHFSAFNILYDIRIDATKQLAALPLGYHTKHTSGSIKKNLELSVEKIETFIAHQIPDVISGIVFPIGILIVMFSVDWKLSLISLIPIVLGIFLQATLYMNQSAKDMMREYHDQIEDMNAHAVEYVRGMPAVKIFGLTVHSFKRFYKSIDGYKRMVLGMTKKSKHPYLAFQVFIASIVLFVLPVGIFMLSKDPMDLALALSIMMFLVIAPGITSPLHKLMFVASNIMNIEEGVTRIVNIFKEEPLKEPLISLEPQTHDLVFEHVSFDYGKEKVLKDISFTCKQHTLTALVGPSGAGKSTIAALIPRFYDVVEGDIKIGDVSLRDMKMEDLLTHVSFVFQDVTLFYDSIYENIRMGRKASKEEIIEAAQKARAHDFIMELENGYDEKIGEGGVYLSGGEAQRISIARALLKDAPILVLDEATAYADAENEQYIQEAIRDLIKDKTVIVIAHRLKTIQHANQIIVIDDGKIVEKGLHEDLLNNKGLYANMWHAHMSANTWKLGDVL